jgi:thioredoxin-related protein
MKKLFILAITILFVFTTAKAGSEISFFTGTFKEAQVKAKQENKLIFLDCYATWCGPCKWMSAHVFTNDTVANFFNRNFVCVAQDMEKGEGLELAKTYSVKNYPTYIWADATGKQIQRSVGSTSAGNFLSIAGNAIDPKKNLNYLKEQYLADNRKPEFLLQYAHALSAAYDMSYQTIADEYFRTQPVEQLAGETNWKTILEFTPNLNSYIYGQLEKSPDAFYKKYGKDSVQHVMNDLALRSIDFAAQQKDSMLFEKAVTHLRTSIDVNVQKQSSERELAYYKSMKDWNRYALKARLYVPIYFMNDADMLNAVCWTFFQRIDDKEKLASAEEWIAQSVKLKDEYANTDTYANILNKEGKTKEAIDMAKHSIEMAKKAGEDYSETEKLLNDMQKGN